MQCKRKGVSSCQLTVIVVTKSFLDGWGIYIPGCSAALLAESSHKAPVATLFPPLSSLLKRFGLTEHFALPARSFPDPPLTLWMNAIPLARMVSKCRNVTVKVSQVWDIFLIHTLTVYCNRVLCKVAFRWGTPILHAHTSQPFEESDKLKYRKCNLRIARAYPTGSSHHLFESYKKSRKG